MSNLKMAGVALHPCPEVEQLEACSFFGKGLCPSCYAEPLLKLRKATTKHVHKHTPKKGLVRLGTYIEILPHHYDRFKAGEGTWTCCGSTWSRPDFPTRRFFLITRGLNPTEFYERIAADPYCVNIQVSVDILPDGGVVPDEERLAEYARIPKVLFRAKSTPLNAWAWAPLFDRLQVTVGRVMETPLRSRVLETKLEDGAFAYGRKTLLEDAGWDSPSFMRCNTACKDCHKENGVLACAVTPNMMARLPDLQRPAPPRHTYTLHHLAWSDEARRMLAELGGSATVREAYAWFETHHPELIVGKPNWQFKVRTAIQRVAAKGEDGKWHLPTLPLIMWDEGLYSMDAIRGTR